MHTVWLLWHRNHTIYILVYSAIHIYLPMYHHTYYAYNFGVVLSVEYNIENPSTLHHPQRVPFVYTFMNTSTYSERKGRYSHC